LPADEDLAGIADDVWSEFARRLTDTGVFADETRDFLPSQLAQSLLPKIEEKVRMLGYAGGSLELAQLTAPSQEATFLIFDKDRLGDSVAAEAAWKTNYYERWRRRVNDRVTDWRNRLAELRSKFETWINESSLDGLALVDRPPMVMNEELMRRFKVPPVQLPVYEINRRGTPLLRIQPKGLWVIGGNGRVDITGRNASLTLVDQSESLSNRADWRIYERGNQRVSKPFDREVFLSLLQKTAA